MAFCYLNRILYLSRFIANEFLLIIIENHTVTLTGAPGLPAADDRHPSVELCALKTTSGKTQLKTVCGGLYHRETDSMNVTSIQPQPCRKAIIRGGWLCENHGEVKSP
jgi:hypothetical protein